MADYDDTNQGVLFQNDKDGNEKRPDYKGKLNVNGKNLEIAGWKRLSKKGQPFLSLKVSDPAQEEWNNAQKSTDSWEKAREKFKPDTVAEVPEQMSDEDFLKSIPF